MNKDIVLGVLIGFILTVILVGVSGFFLYPNFLSESRNPVGETAAVKCYAQKNLCEKFTSAADGGSLKITIFSYTGAAAKNLEVDLGTQPGAPEYYMKYTDKNGVAEFDGIPSGAYVIYFNGVTFIKDYGSSNITEQVEINKNQTTEKTIRLLPGY